jgi:hypothetical protein
VSISNCGSGYQGSSPSDLAAFFGGKEDLDYRWSKGDEDRYPVDHLKAVLDANGAWRFTHKAGRPY